MEMSIILRTNNQNEKIESVLKRICDPSSFNQLHNLKKKFELNVFDENEDNTEEKREILPNYF